MPWRDLALIPPPMPGIVPSILDLLTPDIAVAPAAVHRQRLRSADLRNRLVPTSPIAHRLLGDFPRRAPRRLHGRNVRGKPGPPATHLPPLASLARLRRSGSRDRRE